jgi:hypothetical protein
MTVQFRLASTRVYKEIERSFLYHPGGTNKNLPADFVTKMSIPLIEHFSVHIIELFNLIVLSDYVIMRNDAC